MVGAIVDLVAADFVVYKLEDLKEMNTADRTSHYIALVNDIEMNEAYRASRPTNGVEFMGMLNGLGHAIIGIKLTVWDDQEGKNITSFSKFNTFQNLIKYDIIFLKKLYGQKE